MGDAKGKVIVLRKLDQNRKMNRGTYQVHVSYSVGQQHFKLPLTSIYCKDIAQASPLVCVDEGAW